MGFRFSCERCSRGAFWWWEPQCISHEGWQHTQKPGVGLATSFQNSEREDCFSCDPCAPASGRGRTSSPRGRLLPAALRDSQRGSVSERSRLPCLFLSLQTVSPPQWHLGNVPFSLFLAPRHPPGLPLPGFPGSFLFIY